MRKRSALRRIVLLFAMCTLLVTSVTACGPKKLFNAGTYTATVGGFNGPIVVEVSFSEQKILSVKILEHMETEYIAAPAFEKIPAAIVKDQKLNVDIVSGASYTSDAIIAAVKECVKKAGGDVDALIKRK